MAIPGLRISWRAQWFSLLLHGVVAATVLLVPWPAELYPDLAAAAVAGGLRLRAQPAAGSMPVAGDKLLTDSVFAGKTPNGNPPGTPWVINSGMLRLRHVDAGADSMLAGGGQRGRAGEWRDHRRLVLQKPAGSKPRPGKSVRPFRRICSHQLWIARPGSRSYWLVSSSARPTTVSHRRSPVSGW